MCWLLKLDTVFNVKEQVALQNCGNSVVPCNSVYLKVKISDLLSLDTKLMFSSFLLNKK